MPFEQISVIGLGYIGLPTAAVLASRMGNVIGVDVRSEIVNAVNTGTVKTVESGLAELVEEMTRAGKLRAAMSPACADVFIIAVPTPITNSQKPNIEYVQAAVLSLAPVLRQGNLIILESTSPVGTTEKIAEWLAGVRPDLTFPQQAGDGADIQIAYCPERILPGKMLTELIFNDRIVGGVTTKSTEMAKNLYSLFVQGEIIGTDVRTAELCKLVENSFRDVNIAFANELSMICGKLGINVWEVISLANRHPRVNILKPGCGVGGHCIPVDPWFIVDSVPDDTLLIQAARTVNDAKPRWSVEKIKIKIDEFLSRHPQKTMKDVKVSCFGLTFKPDVDDLRGSPAMEIVESVARLGCQTCIVEPNIKKIPKNLIRIGVQKCSASKACENSDIILILVKHTVFKRRLETLLGNTTVCIEDFS